MSCNFSDFNGKCEFFEDGVERPVDKEGCCLCEDDENPIDSCEDFQER